MTQEQNKQENKEQKPALPLRTEEIVSILNKTSNEQFSRENKISSNISSDFKGFSLQQIAKKIEKKSDVKENNFKKPNENEIASKSSDKSYEKEKNEDIEKKVEEEKVYTKEEANKIANDLSKKSYDDGHKVGYEEGVKKIKEELQKGEEALAMALKNTIDNLFHITPVFLKKLNININKSIKEICNQIVGYEISAFPEKFVEKIHNLVESINDSSNKIKIFLNKDDLSAVTKYLSREKISTDASFLEEKDLNRGDLIIKSGGIEINDIVSSKIDLASESNIEKELELLSEENDLLKQDLSASSQKDNTITKKKLEDDEIVINEEKKELISNSEKLMGDENKEISKLSEESKNNNLESNS